MPLLRATSRQTYDNVNQSTVLEHLVENASAILDLFNKDNQTAEERLNKVY